MSPQKIVKNKSRDPFNISLQALAKLLDMESEIVGSQPIEGRFGSDFEFDPPEDLDDFIDQIVALTEAEGHFMNTSEGEIRENISEIEEGNSLYYYGSGLPLYDLDSGQMHYLEDSVDRDHPDLVQVVEELGDDASGQWADLEVVEIPDDVEWEITQDGRIAREVIREVGRTW